MTLRALALAAAACFAVPLMPTTGFGQETAAPAPAGEVGRSTRRPTTEQRFADLESYFGNIGVGAAGDEAWDSKIGGNSRVPVTTAG